MNNTITIVIGIAIANEIKMSIMLPPFLIPLVIIPAIVRFPRLKNGLFVIS